jgi:DNA repair protein RAD57
MPSSTPDSPLPFSLPPDDVAASPPVSPVLHLDHQQRWFTGWGDETYSSYALKTPSLGLVWTTQIACRVALFRRPVYGPSRHTAPLMAHDDDYDPDAAAPTLRAWRRWMKVVFAPHAQASGPGIDGAVEFEITTRGLNAVTKKSKRGKTDSNT